MPFYRLGLFLSLTLTAAQLTSAQIVVDSAFIPQGAGYYGDANNWSPPEVPNNSPEKIYNITISSSSIRMNVDATVSNVTLNSATVISEGEGHTLSVNGGTTVNHIPLGWDFVLTSQFPIGSTFAAGSLSSFSEGTLTGGYYLSSYNTSAGWSTLQFNGARVSTLTNARLALVGPSTRVVDEFGNDALRELKRIDGESFLQLNGRQLILPGTFTNDGQLTMSAGFDQPALFTITGALTNFDAASRTLTGGVYSLGGNYIAGSNHPTVLQFAGADIVHNGATIVLADSRVRIVDQNGSDALRNFSHNTALGFFGVFERDFSISGDFTNDGVLSLWLATFTVEGSLTNFNPPTRTLTGGTYRLDGNAGPVRFIFDGADIVDNAASIYLSGGAKILDENGNDALRNFAHNLKSGEFTINDSYMFTAAADFTNAGVMNIQGFGDVSRAHFTVPEGHRYLQTEGETLLWDAKFTGQMEIASGTFTTAGNPNFGNPAVLTGDLTIDDALFFPGAFAVQGAVGLSANSRFLTRPEQYGLFTVAETFTAGGILKIAPPQIAPSASEIFSVVQSDGGVIGTFSNAPHGRRIPTIDGGGSFIVSYTPNTIFLSGFQGTPFTGQLLNISTRLRVGTGEDVLIGGFIITGTQPKTIIVRAIGPSLSSLPGALADPILELRDSSGGLIAFNDNWRSDQEAEIIASALPPGHDSESAIVATLPAQNSAYTAIVRGVNNGTGIGLVEVYDLAPTLDSKPANISTRGLVQTGDNVLIGGLIILGQNPLNVIVRAMGPSLPLPGALEDPTLSLHDGNGAVVAFNDNWRSEQEAEIIATGIPPGNNLESAIVTTVPANGGFYTAIVRGQDGASGVGLIEVYALNE